MSGPVVMQIRPTLDTSAYADGDVLFVPVELVGLSAQNVPVLLQTLTVVDQSDQGAAFDLLFFRRSVALGTLNAAPSISDADALFFAGRVSVASSDYYDVGGARVADVADLSRPRLMSTGENSSSLWVAGISRGTGTYAADALQIRLGFLR